MQRKQSIPKADKKVRKVVSPKARQVESVRQSDSQLIREILDRRHQVSIILS
ncbi:MAG: hypothetical protein PHH85_08340 [Candidatus Methanoperedens sp.]|nr:hypothetical protein [Candidatus Methanoperedens sp.]